MTFREEFILLLLDKGLLAGIAFVLWHFHSQSQHRAETKQRKLEQLEEEVRQLERERRRTEVSEEIALLERQLGEFLWPMQYFLQKDDALWERVPDLSSDAKLPKEAGRALERDAVIPNHEAALQTIEKHFGLIATNAKLADAIIRYVRHVTVYRALRLSNQVLNPIDVNEPFPPDLPEMIEQVTASVRQRLEQLRRQRWDGGPAAG